jgi:alpha-L-rhamnosidase
MSKKHIFLLFACLLCLMGNSQSWPATDSITKPWTRWWWLGSAVNEKGLDDNLEALRAAGIGGVEITPIYGIKGQEQAFVPFLTKRWVDLLTHTLNLAAQKKMGVDMANATGWPFGGPWVGPEDASKTIFRKKFKVQSGKQLDSLLVYHHPGLVRTANTTKRRAEDIPQNMLGSSLLQEYALDQIQFPGKLPLETVVAYGPDNQSVNLSASVSPEGRLNWTAPEGEWEVWALFKGLHGKMVERAAPGGEGYAIDHFSQGATTRYLQHFTEAFQGRDLNRLRGFFNDSYEVDDASGQGNWTTGMFEQFLQVKGYDLRNHLPALFGEGDSRQQSRVLFDYRSVIDSMILRQFTGTWKQWGDAQGKILRNQSHGSPANTLDLYSVVDIPETEGTDWLRFKFATSAAHVAGKKLVSAEAATWLDEHFLSTWGDVKKALDLYFLAGVNHIVYHGTPYSSPQASWPGWNFYAAVQFQPTNPQWAHFHQLNTYVTRIQSFLQRSKPSHQVLLYYPLHDRYAQTGGPLLQHFDGMERNFEHTDFEALSRTLQKSGIGFDFISDRQLLQTHSHGGKLTTGGTSYKMVVVPQIKVMDWSTWQRLADLAASGSEIVFHRQLPAELPGLANLEERQKKWNDLMASLVWTSQPWGKQAAVGKGKMTIVDDWTGWSAVSNLQSGRFEQAGLQAYEQDLDGKSLAFVANRQDHVVDVWVETADRTDPVYLYNPMTGTVTLAQQSAGRNKFRLQLQPHETVIVSWETAKGKGKPHQYLDEPVNIQPIEGQWTVHFEKGGPTIPADLLLKGTPMYWTAIGDSIYQSFSGLATYSIRFAVGQPEGHWQLDLGGVSATAAVKLNGRNLGASIGPKHLLDLPTGLLKVENVLEVQVANLMANRIAFMDRNNIPWKIFYNINMSAKRKENLLNGVFDARHWQPMPSGLNGPVRLMQFK